MTDIDIRIHTELQVFLTRNAEAIKTTLCGSGEGRDTILEGLITQAFAKGFLIGHETATEKVFETLKRIRTGEK